MNWEIWLPLLIAIAAWIPKLWEIIGNRNKTKAETNLIVSEESGNISKAAETAVNVLLQALNFNQNESRQYQERVRTLETNQDKNTELIKELTAHKAERDNQIKELQEHNDALQSGMTGLQAQIKKDTDETQSLRREVEEVKEKYKKQVRINARLIKALEDANIPLPDFNGDVGETLKGLTWPEGKPPK